jgi:hypothetical protein
LYKVTLMVVVAVLIAGFCTVIVVMEFAGGVSTSGHPRFKHSKNRNPQNLLMKAREYEGKLVAKSESICGVREARVCVCVCVCVKSSLYLSLRCVCSAAAFSHAHLQLCTQHNPPIPIVAQDEQLEAALRAKSVSIEESSEKVRLFLFYLDV